MTIPFTVLRRVVFLPVGEPVDDALGRLSAETRDDISNHLRMASSVEQVARICGAPVIALVPGLSLEVARKAALLRINGLASGVSS